MIRTLGTCYYPEQWDESLWQSDAKSMVELGLTWVRINEFAWAKIEPRPGEFNFLWLDRIIAILGKQNLKVVLGTPTAAPPRWIIDKHPDMLIVGEDGRKRSHGSRRHYCFSHKGYAKECERIVEILAERYGGNPFVSAWQIDNEFGCHDTTLSYSDSALTAFQCWLRKQYSSKYHNNDGPIGALNNAWGNVFWSMEYQSFSEISLPNNTVTEPNPAHIFAFRKFSSQQVINFNKRQVEIIRRFSDAPITHNFMGKTTDFNHFEVGRDLDFSSWDSYPLGFLADRIDTDERLKKEFARQGDPDFQAFHHDLYRSVGNGRWWVMEQQPGPVNWAPYNPNPMHGMLKLWTWEAFAHGAETVSYFRWRQVPFGQEQMHSGLHLQDGTKSNAYYEVQDVANELKKTKHYEQISSKIAIIFDYGSSAAWDIQPHGKNLNYFNLIFDFYKSLRKLGQSIDIIPQDHRNFEKYKIIFGPGLMIMCEKLKSRLSKFNGQVFLGPRTSTRDLNLNTTIPLPPNLPGFDANIILTETFRRDSPIQLEKGGNFCYFREHFDGKFEIIEKTKSGDPAIIRGGNFNYIAGWPDQTVLNRILKNVFNEEKMDFICLPEGVRIRETLRERFWFNYSSKQKNVGEKILEPCSVFRECI